MPVVMGNRLHPLTYGLIGPRLAESGSIEFGSRNTREDTTGCPVGLRYLAVSVAGWTDPVWGTSLATGWGLDLEGTPHGVSLSHGLNVKGIEFTFWRLVWSKHRACFPSSVIADTHIPYLFYISRYEVP